MNSCAYFKRYIEFAFPGELTLIQIYGHEDKQQLQINGGQRLDVIFDYLLENEK